MVEAILNALQARSVGPPSAARLNALHAHPGQLTQLLLLPGCLSQTDVDSPQALARTISGEAPPGVTLPASVLGGPTAGSESRLWPLPCMVRGLTSLLGTPRAASVAWRLAGRTSLPQRALISICHLSLRTGPSESVPKPAATKKSSARNAELAEAYPGTGIGGQLSLHARRRSNSVH
jgi:hypothetical protein